MIKFKKLNADAIIPTRASSGAAGFDIYADDFYLVRPHIRCLLNTGIAMQLPEGFWGEIKPRSGLAAKYGIDVLAGVIDSDYTGEIKVSLINHGDMPFEIKKGDRIAQLIVQRHETIFTLVDDFETTTRGNGGFGSTGR